MKFLSWISILSFLITPSVKGYTNLAPDDVHNWLIKGDTLVLLDVREISEYRAGHIAEPVGLLPLTPVNMPLNSSVLAAEFARLPKDIDIIVYCQSGGRSASASSFLESKGFTRIFNMTGGYSSWTFESRAGGFGDHSGGWIHTTDTQFIHIIYQSDDNLSEMVVPPKAVPNNEDSIYIELHLTPPGADTPSDVPSSQLNGLFRLSVLDKFGLSKFNADSLVLSDTVDISLTPNYIGDKHTINITGHNMTGYIPGKGWRNITYTFEDYSFRRKEIVLRRWYNVAVQLLTGVLSNTKYESPEIHIFPNPFNNILHISAPEMTAIYVYDIRGRLIKQFKKNYWIPDINVSTGLYFMRIDYSNIAVIKKITYLK